MEAPLPVIFRFIGAQAISSLGSAMSYFILPLAVLDLTGSPFQVTVIMALLTIPYAIVGLPAGTLVDRVSRKQLMMTSDLVRGLSIGLVPWVLRQGPGGLPYLYGIALIEGTFNALQSVAEVSSLPRLAGTTNLARAVGLQYASLSVMQFLGPPLAGFLYQHFGASPVFFADAVSFFASLLIVGSIRTPFQLSPSQRETVDSLVGEMKRGFKELVSRPLLFHSLVAVALINLCGASLNSLLIVFFREERGLGSGVLGIALGLTLLGGMAGALLAPRLMKRLRYRGLFLLMLSLETVARFALPAGGGLPSLLAVILLIFFADSIVNVAVITVRQQSIPDSLLGKVNSLFRTVVFATRPVSQLLAGGLMIVGGSRGALVATAFLYILPLLYSLKYMPRTDGQGS